LTATAPDTAAIEVGRLTRPSVGAHANRARAGRPLAAIARAEGSDRLWQEAIDHAIGTPVANIGGRSLLIAREIGGGERWGGEAVSAIVREIMNGELFYVGPDEPAGPTGEGILAMGITAAPVLDGNHRPLGVVSLRDLMEARNGARVSARMTSPAVVVRDDAGIADAARLVGETGHRHLVVVDETGRAVGMVSAVDLVRALVGLPARHPASFPHFDRRTGLTWTDDAVLDVAHLDRAPDGPGLILLVHDAPGVPRRVVWVEASQRVLTRLTDMLSVPQDSPQLVRWLEDRAQLRFRIGVAHDTGALGRGLIEALRDKSRAADTPGGAAAGDVVTARGGR
jgi:CBS domain-containing protein